MATAICYAMHSCDDVHFESNLTFDAALRESNMDDLCNVVMLYEDPVTCKWANRMWSAVMESIGKNRMHVTSWWISDLACHDILSSAVKAAAQADILVIAVNAQEELPIDLHVWCDIWLPRRHKRPGVLVALIALLEENGHEEPLFMNYFRAAARKGSLDFFSQSRVLTPYKLKVSRQIFVPIDNHNPAELTKNPVINNNSYY